MLPPVLPPALLPVTLELEGLGGVPNESSRGPLWMFKPAKALVPVVFTDVFIVLSPL